MMKGQAKLLDPFKDNLYRRSLDAATGARFLEKSCPKCSKKAGATIYYVESEFEAISKDSGKVEMKRDCQRHRKAVSIPASV